MREACDSLPSRFQRLLRNVAVTVEDLPNANADPAVGFYEGTPIGERGTGYTLTLPDKITIYRLPLLEICGSQLELRSEVHLTVLHEVGHYFGMDDDEIPF